MHRDAEKRETGQQYQRPDSGKGLAVAVAVLAVLLIVAVPTLLVPALGRHHEAQLRCACAENLKQLGTACKAFVEKQENGAFPPLSRNAGRLMWSADAMGPFIKETRAFVCPADPGHGARIANEYCFVNDESYFYLGYAVTDEQQMQAFCAAYKERIVQGLPFDTDLQVSPGPENAGVHVIHRMRQGMYDVEALSRIPVLIERLENHDYVVPGGNVLFMDGHVEFIRFPGQWPMTEKTINALKELDAMGK